jgi:putative acetyltransferase
VTIIRQESLDDIAAIEQVNRLAFGGEEEARLVALLRDGGYARLSLVAEVENQVVGHILFSELSIATDRGVIPALSLAPLAVIPSRQRSGIGTALVAQGLRICRDAGHKIVIVLGHPEYYPRFGFSAKLAEPLRSLYSGPNFMATELAPEALDGVEGDVRYSPPFEQSLTPPRSES